MLLHGAAGPNLVRPLVCVDRVEAEASMGYLQPTDYVNYGLAPDTTDDWIMMASSVIEAFCRRTSLNPTQYTERLRVIAGSQTVRLSYLPLVTTAPATTPFISLEGRLTRPRRGEIPYPELGEVAYAFALPGQWTTFDPTSVDFDPNTGEILLPYNLLGMAYGEVMVTYTAGLVVIPPAILVACAQIVKNAQATPGLNVKQSKMDTMQMQYFSGSLVDPQVQMLLAPYVASRLG